MRPLRIRKQSAVRARRITDEKGEEIGAVLSAVQDLPHVFADRWRRKEAAEDDRRLEHDALLLQPHQAEEHEIDDNDGERDEQKQHVRCEGRRRCAGFLRTDEECNLRGCVFQSKPFGFKTGCT